MKNNMTLFTNIFVKTFEAKKHGSHFLIFRPHEPGFFQTWLKHGSTHEPGFLKLKWATWLKHGSGKTTKKQKHGSWLNVYIYMSQ